jgi:serine/threonine protein kinase
VNENFIWKVAYDILKGLRVLHANQIIHRDVKPANVFFVDGTAKLGDMNVSKVLDGKYASTQTGTPYYTSPEIWNNAKYDGRVDVWSLGCLLYELTALKPPFVAKDFPGLSRKILQGAYDPVPPFYSRRLAELIRRCLTLRMADRPTARDLLKESVFEEMGNVEEGEVELLDTIRCPKVLRMLQQKLPECRSFKRVATQKDLEKEEEEPKEGVVKSLKKIASSKLLPLFINLNPSIRLLREGKENDKLPEQMKVLRSLCSRPSSRPTATSSCPGSTPTGTSTSDLILYPALPSPPNLNIQPCRATGRAALPRAAARAATSPPPGTGRT